MNNWWAPFIAPIVYAGMILYLVWETQRNGRNDKHPCLIAKGRNRHNDQNDASKSGRKYDIRIINVGRGPAFIERFYTKGLTSYPDGEHIDHIDKVIAPDVGDSALQIMFTEENDLQVLRNRNTSIYFDYKDISGRLFKSGIRNGVPFWEPPDDFKYSLIDRLHNWICCRKHNG